MIQIERITSIPDLDWTPWSRQEMEFFDKREMERKSHVMVMACADDAPTFVAGLIYRSYADWPWLWLLMTNNYRTSHAVRATRQCLNLAPKAYTLINRNFAEGKRFAEFFGFHPGYGLVQHEGRTFEVWGRC